MNSSDFNKKYEKYLEEGHYGLAVNDTKFIQWLDNKFEEFIKRPGFKFSQIKIKFGMGRFYAEGLTSEEIVEVQNKITETLSK